MNADEIRTELYTAYDYITKVEGDRIPYLFAHALVTALVEALLALLESEPE